MKPMSWMLLAAAATVLGCGGKVLDSEGDTEATGGSAGTGGSGGSPGTGATGGAPGTGATGGSPGTGGTSLGGSGGGPSAFVSSCMEYASMSFDQPACASCLQSALEGGCSQIVAPLEEESGPCGEVIACFDSTCGPVSPDQLCPCLEGCVAVGSASCEARWTQAFQCLNQACSGVCG